MTSPITLKPGQRLRSAADTTEVMVVRAPSVAVELTCGGLPMLAPGEDAPEGTALDPAWSAGTQVGKRYESDALGLEVLCTKAGPGSLGINGDVLELKDAKPLPASD